MGTLLRDCEKVCVVAVGNVNVRGLCQASMKRLMDVFILWVAVAGRNMKNKRLEVFDQFDQFDMFLLHESGNE